MWFDINNKFLEEILSHVVAMLVKTLLNFNMEIYLQHIKLLNQTMLYIILHAQGYMGTKLLSLFIYALVM